MSREHVALLVNSSGIMDRYFKKKFVAAMMNDMKCDEPEIGLNLLMMEIEAETICLEIGRIGLEVLMEELI